MPADYPALQANCIRAARPGFCHSRRVRRAIGLMPDGDFGSLYPSELYLDYIGLKGNIVIN